MTAPTETGTILDRIVAETAAELARRREAAPLPALERRAAAAEPPRDFAAALRPTASDVKASPRLIAEVKKASPSKGLLCPDFDPARLAQGYAAGGAAALSVLTEPRFFQGDPSHLAVARRAGGLATLRKDFLFDPYQVVEARAIGADAVLLIVAILEDAVLRELLGLARALGMAALVEVHDAAELDRALVADATLIGVNNRNLRTFEVDLETTRRLRARIPRGRLVVSESGIHSPADVGRLREWEVDAMLVGESLVRSGDVAAKARELLGG